MARIDNLTDFLTDVSDAIKQKTGDSTPIPASEFDLRISEIETKGNYQTKEITINTNGNYNLSPDEGYDALSDVTIRAEIDSGVDLSDATATADDILFPKTAYLSDNSKHTGTIMHADSIPYTEYIIPAATNRYCDISNDGKVYAYSSGKTLYVYELRDGVLTLIVSQSTGMVYNTTSCRVANAVDDGKLNIYVAAEGHDSDYKQMGCLRVNLDDENYPVSKYWYGVSDNMMDHNWTGCWTALYPHPTRPNIVVAVFPSRDSRGTFFKLMQINDTSIIEKNSIKLTLKYDTNWSGAYDYSLCHWATDNLFYVQDDTLAVSYKLTYVFDEAGNLTSGTSELSTNIVTGFKSYTENYIFANKTLYTSNGNMIKTFTELGMYTHLFETTAGLVVASIVNNVYDIYLLDDTYNLIHYQGPYATNVTNPFHSSGTGHLFDKIRFISMYTSSNGRILTVNNLFNVGKGYVIHGVSYYDTSEATGKSSELLNGKILYDKNKKVIGSMPDNGGLTYNPSINSQKIPAGYTSGGIIKPVTAAIDMNIIPENIRNTVTILGVEGTYEGSTGGDATSDGNLQAKYLLEGYSAVVDGKLIQGTMKDYGTETIIATSEDIEIPEGHYDSLSIPIINAANCADYTECSQALASI